jgi:uncharacterized membrane protein YfcA
LDLATAVFLSAAGFAGGIVTAIVGAASLLTFPALLAAGVPPVIASASNCVAMTPSNFVAAWADYRRLPPFRPAFFRVLAIAAVGSAIGAWLLMVTPDASFEKLVPILIGVATALFAFSGNVRRWIVRHGEDPALHSARADRIGLVLLAPVAVYAGYFGAGVSIMLLAILALGPKSDFRTINALKNLLSGTTGVLAMIIFIAKGMVAWPQTLAMVTGALTGGYVGAHLARRVPEAIVRWIVIVVGVTVTVISIRRYWWIA